MHQLKIKRVVFNETVKVGETYPPNYYDRNSIHCDPITKEDVLEVIQMRQAMGRQESTEGTASPSKITDIKPKTIMDSEVNPPSADHLIN